MSSNTTNLPLSTDRCVNPWPEAVKTMTSSSHSTRGLIACHSEKCVLDSEDRPKTSPWKPRGLKSQIHIKDVVLVFKLPTQFGIAVIRCAGYCLLMIEMCSRSRSDCFILHAGCALHFPECKSLSLVFRCAAAIWVSLLYPTQTDSKEFLLKQLKA